MLKTRPKSDNIDLLGVYARKHKLWNETLLLSCTEVQKPLVTDSKQSVLCIKLLSPPDMLSIAQDNSCDGQACHILLRNSVLACQSQFYPLFLPSGPRTSSYKENVTVC